MIANDKTILNIGYQAENGARTIEFDYADAYNAHPGGSITIRVLLPGQTEWIPIIPQVDEVNHVATWLVSDSCLGKAGTGECQLVYSWEGGNRKSKIWQISINRALVGDGTNPPEWSDIRDEMEQLYAGTVDKAESAAVSAEVAETEAQAAGEKADEANTYAIQAEGYATQAETAKGEAVEAKADAVEAKAEAEQAATEAKAEVESIEGKSEQIDQNTADIATHTTEIESLGTELGELTTTVEGHTETIGALGVDLEALTEDVGELTETVDDHTTAISQLNNTKLNKTEIEGYATEATGEVLLRKEETNVALLDMFVETLIRVLDEDVPQVDTMEDLILKIETSNGLMNDILLALKERENA